MVTEGLLEFAVHSLLGSGGGFVGRHVVVWCVVFGLLCVTSVLLLVLDKQGSGRAKWSSVIVYALYAMVNVFYLGTAIGKPWFGRELVFDLQMVVVAGAAGGAGYFAHRWATKLI